MRAASGLRALGRALRPGLWNAVVLAALVLLAACAAAVPLVRAATDQAALADAVSRVPAGVQAADAPVVQVTTGLSPRGDAGRLLAAPGTIRGLGEPVLLGRSAGPELNPGSTFFPRISPVVVAGDRSARARVVAVERPADRLVPATPGPRGAAGGVWLPDDLAAELGVAVGATVDVGTLEGPLGRQELRTVALPVAGTYRTRDRRPVGPPGDDFWSEPWLRLPVDSELAARTAHLVVVDPDVAEVVTARTEEPFVWTSFARLDPPVPTLADAARIREEVRALDSRAARLDGGRTRIRTDVASGIPAVVEQAERVAAAVRSMTTGQAWAAVALGLGVVLGLAALGARRRATELAAVAAQGRHPGRTAAATALATVPPALVAVGLGAVLARAGAGLVHPVTVGPQLWRTALLRAGEAVAAGLAVVLVVTLVAAVAAARPGLAGAPRRGVPWPSVLAAAAVAAAAGVLSRPEGDAGRGLDVLAPVLVVAAVAAVGARLAVRGLAAAADRLAGRPGRPTPPALLLALRRSGRGATAREGVLVAWAVGTALLLFALTTAAGVGTAVEEKTTVAAGVEARARLDGTWLLDPSAPARPGPLPDGTTPPKPDLRTPATPPGTTIVWRDAVSLTTTGDLPTMLVVDPAGFDATALWGSSPQLRAAREALRRTAVEARSRAPSLEASGTRALVPAIAVGRFRAALGDDVSVLGSGLQFTAEVVETVDAFPGLQRRQSMLVVPADAYLTVSGLDDPRMRQQGLVPRAEVWSRDGVPGLRRVLDPAGVPLTDVVTRAGTDQEPSLVAGRRTAQYRVLLGLAAAVVAGAALLGGVDRTLVEGRAEDVLLDRMGLGRKGVAAARVLETGALVGTGTVLAVAATVAAGVVAERMLDPDPGLAPSLSLRPDATTAVVLVATAAGAWLATVVLVVRRLRADDAAAVLRDAR